MCKEVVREYNAEEEGNIGASLVAIGLGVSSVVSRVSVSRWTSLAG